MKEKLLFKTISGSYLYGTNGKNSDTDYKGVFLPEIDDLLLLKAPKHYTLSSSGNEKNSSEDIDETYYSLQYFLELAAKGETNAIDLLFAYTNKNAVIQTSDIWNELTQNIDKILTRNINAYLGYCKSQCVKYSLKGEKLNNFNEFKRFCEKYLNEDITLYEALIKEFYSSKDTERYLNEFIDWTSSSSSKVKIMNSLYNFGNHCYIIVANNREVFLQISDVKFQMKDNIKGLYHKVNEIIESYGRRAKQAAEQKGIDYKAISHCVRVLFQVEELLKTNKITFPLKDAEVIKSIKYNTSNLSYDELMNLIEDKIIYIENVLLPNSTLREKADYKWIENFILKCYK